MFLGIFCNRIKFINGWRIGIDVFLMLIVEGGVWGLGFVKVVIDFLCLCWGLGEGVCLGVLEILVVVIGLIEFFFGCELCIFVFCFGE